MVRKKFTHENISRVRNGPGVYKLFSKQAKNPTYIGETNDLPRRLIEHKTAKDIILLRFSILKVIE